MSTRKIERTILGIKTSDGAGVKLKRLIGTPILRSLDPFLMLDDFGSDEPNDYLAGFPDHPHRGFETITYMVEGKFRHKDNKGHEGILETGGAQWMTAGRGIVHSEMPIQKEGRVRGLQLWLNLPAKDKMCVASYRDLQRDDIPVVTLEGGAVARVLAGRIAGVTGAIVGRETDPVYIDVTVPARKTATVPVPKGHAGFVYSLEGEIAIAGRKLGQGELGVMTDGEEVELHAEGGEARVIVIAGKPLREPVVQYGPFVMNTPEQIEDAIRDFQANRF